MLPPAFDLAPVPHARYPQWVEALGPSRRDAVRSCEQALAATLAGGASTRSPVASAQNLPAAWQEAYDRWRFAEDFSGRRLLDPTLENQRFWARSLGFTGAAQSFAAGAWQPNDSAWPALQLAAGPLIARLATRAHQEGRAQLGLDQPEPPTFTQLSAKVATACGFTLAPADGEADVPTFFALLSERCFPVVEKVRPASAAFCGFAPDLWHESIGHLAWLTNPEHADLLTLAGRKVTQLYRGGRASEAQALAQILWVVFEYGLVMEGDRVRAFGAALVSSVMGLARLEAGVYRPAEQSFKRIHRRALYREDGPKGGRRKIELPLFRDVASIRHAVADW